MRAILILAFNGLWLATAAEAPYRVVVYDVKDPPQVRTVIDVRLVDGVAPKLTAREFRLLEDGNRTTSAEQALEFGQTDLAVALIVLLDASPSMKGKPLDAIRRGLAQLVSRKRAQDWVAVLSFANDLRWEANWEASSDSLQAAFRNLQARGNRTRLYDAIGEALSAFDERARQHSDFPLRRSVLVLSDGHDEGSTTTLAAQTRRLGNSRVRLDAVGLARSELWLRSLQTLAHTGFGSFRKADTPEALTDLLERGLDVLLQTPVLEFRAQNLKADGRSHEAGIEHTPSGWRDNMTVTLPEYVLYKDRRVWVGGGIAGVLLLGFALLMFTRSQRRSTAVAARPAPIPAFPSRATEPPSVDLKPRTPSMPVQRTATIAEPVSQATSAVDPSYSVSYSQPAPVKPARPSTVLAPQTSERMILVALAGPIVGKQVELNAREFWIGSGTNNHLCLSADPTVSGNHACIRAEGNVHRIFDNGSMNNTWVNGNPVGDSAVLLHGGDRIVIGQSEFVFQS